MTFTKAGIPVIRCGHCGMGFLKEVGLRVHQEIPDLRDDGALHDGQPWTYEYIVKGLRMIWHAHDFRFNEPVEVLDVHESAKVPGQFWVLLRGMGPAGRRWHELERVVEACFPPQISVPARVEDGVLDATFLVRIDEGPDGKVVTESARDRL